MIKTTEIIQKLIDYLQISIATLAERVGYDKPQAFYDVQKGKTKKISPTMADRITNVYPEISRIWLLTGEGEMLNKVEDDLDGDLMVRLKDVDDSYIKAINRLFVEKKIYQSEVVDSLRELVDQLKKENEYLRQEIEELKLK